MSKLIKTLSFIFIWFCTSCIFDSSSTKLIDGYDLTWIDSKWNQSIYKGEEQVSGYIYSVGYNDKFIIAKQHPLKGDFYSTPNYEITNFYIIDIIENSKGHKRGVIGPLKESQFIKLLEKFEIKSELKFTIEE